MVVQDIADVVVRIIPVDTPPDVLRGTARLMDPGPEPSFQSILEQSPLSLLVMNSVRLKIPAYCFLWGSRLKPGSSDHSNGGGLKDIKRRTKRLSLSSSRSSSPRAQEE